MSKKVRYMFFLLLLIANMALMPCAMWAENLNEPERGSLPPGPGPQGAFESQGGPAPFTGGVGAPPMASLDAWGENAAIYIHNGQIIKDSNADAVTIAEGGIISETQISGVDIRYQNIGDWDTTSPGKSGIVIVNDPENPHAKDEITIGGDKDCYTVENEEFNTVVTLKAEDGSQNNSLLKNNIRNPADRNYRTYEGQGIAYSAGKVTLNNVFVKVDGYGRSALEIRGKDDTIVKDSTFISLGGNGKEFTTALWLCMTSSARSNLIMSTGNTYFYNTKMYTNDWGNYSLDGVNGAHVYLVNSYSENRYGGYGLVGLGLGEVDNENWVEVYGCKAVCAQYGLTILTAGYVTIDSLENVSKRALAGLGNSTIGNAITGDGRSFIGGSVAAVCVNSDMNARKDRTGRLTARSTIFSTDSLTDLNGKPIGDNLDLLQNKYKNESVKGGTPYFLLKYAHGSTIWVRGSNLDIDFDRVDLRSSSGVLFRSTLDYTQPLSDVPDGEQAAGIDIDLKNMALAGDVIHEDYQRGMNLNLTGTSLEGTVISGTLAGWNQKMTSFVDNYFDPETSMNRDTILENLTPKTSYDTVWGIRMTIDEGSKWTVTETASLSGLTIESGAAITAPEGYKLTIYNGCAMDNNDINYDITNGTAVTSLVPGVSYEGVVLIVSKSESSR